MARYGMVLDQRKCIGCSSCTVACRTWNDLPIDMIFNPVVSEGVIGKYPNVHQVWTPLLCMHCDNPPCVPCCPTGASTKDPKTGIVSVDPDKCIGCAVCVNACPYGARDVPHEESVGRFHRYAMKCNFCADKVAEGDDPYCVQTCHQKARIFGDLDDPNSEVSKLIDKNQTMRLMEDLGTNPSVYYIQDLGGQR